MLKAVKTDTERQLDKEQAIQHEMIDAIRKDLIGIKGSIQSLQVSEAINESLLTAIRECNANAKYVKDYKNGYITGHEMVELFKNISAALRYQLAILLLQEAEQHIITGGK